MQAGDLASQLMPSGIDRDDFFLIVDDLADLGYIEGDGNGGVILGAAMCGTEYATPTDVWIAALRFYGCSLSEADADPLMAAFGLLDNNVTATAIRNLVQNGRAEFINDGVSLSVAECAGAALEQPAVANGPRQALIAMAQSFDCAMTSDQAEEVIGAFGLTMDQAEDTIDTMIDAGEGQFVSGMFILDDALCSAEIAAPAQVVPVNTVRATVIEMVQDLGCAITENQAAEAVADYGLTRDQADEIIEGMIDSGEGTFAGGRFILGEEYCAAPAQSTGSVDVGAAREAIIAMARANSCVLSEDQAEGMVADYGLDMDQAEDAVMAMIEAEEGLVENGAFVLNAALCAVPSDTPAVGGSVRETIIALTAANGCSLSENEAEGLLAGYDISMDEAEDVIISMVEIGEGQLIAGAFVLSDQLCQQASQAAPTLGSYSPREAMIDMARAQNCALTEEQLVTSIGSYGLDMEQANDGLNTLIDAGDAEFDAGVMTLSSALCQPVLAITVLAPRAALVRLFGQNECGYGLQEFRDVIEAAGLDPETLEPVLLNMIEIGDVAFDNNYLELDAGICAAGNRQSNSTPDVAMTFAETVAAAERLMAEVPDETIANMMLHYVRTSGCELDMSDQIRALVGIRVAIGAQLGLSEEVTRELGASYNDRITDGVNLVEGRFTYDQVSQTLSLQGCTP